MCLGVCVCVLLNAARPRCRQPLHVPKLIIFRSKDISGLHTPLLCIRAWGSWHGKARSSMKGFWSRGLCVCMQMPGCRAGWVVGGQHRREIKDMLMIFGMPAFLPSGVAALTCYRKLPLIINILQLRWAGRAGVLLRTLKYNVLHTQQEELKIHTCDMESMTANWYLQQQLVRGHVADTQTWKGI